MGTRGSLTIVNFVAPNVYHYLSVTSSESDSESGAGVMRTRTRTEKHYGPDGGATYQYQLDVFARAIQAQPNGGVASTPAGALTAGVLDDAAGTMALIDAIYRAGGLAPRVSPPSI